MEIAIVKYNAGNIRSVIYALERLGVKPILTDDENELRSADKVIFPGVGEASSAMNYLNESGLDLILPTLTQPFLGICIGQQLMCANSEEGNASCLGIFPTKVKRFDENQGQKVPHMGWNKLKNLKTCLFEGVDPEHAYVYYVHSYYCALDDQYTIASSDYVHDFSAAYKKDNFYSVQFHPEKSGEVGAMILNNFIEKT